MELEKQQTEHLTGPGADAAVMKAKASTTRVTQAIFFYAFCSASLLVVNKVAVTSIPSASFVLACQFGSSVITVLSFERAGFVSDVSGTNISGTVFLMVFLMLLNNFQGRGTKRTQSATFYWH